MTIFYTFNIFSIKYLGRGFGEMAIFLCFGPLLMEGVSVILTGDYDFDIFIMSLPIGLSAVNILHANNVRDLKTDLNSGIKTLAYYLDEYNYSFYKYIYIISYLIPIVSSLFLNSEFYNFRRSLTILLNIPWTIYLLNCFKNKFILVFNSSNNCVYNNENRLTSLFIIFILLLYLTFCSF